jgi:GT2 family glycosyltransferase
MYFEDVDFCARARLAGCQVLVSRQAKVIHDAQRDSHRKMRYMLWHVGSALRFFTSAAYVRIRLNRLFGA